MFSNEGFTLIEILLALSIISLVCIAYLNVVINSYNIWIDEENYLARNQKGEIAVQNISNHMRNAGDINIAPDESEIEFRCYYRDEGMKWLKYGLYSSAGVQALGIKKAEYGQEAKKYSNYMPLINNVSDLKFINESSNFYKIVLTLKDNDGNLKNYSNYITPVGVN